MSEVLVKKSSNGSVRVYVVTSNDKNGVKCWGNDGIVEICCVGGEFSVSGAFDGPNKLFGASVESEINGKHLGFHDVCEVLLRGASYAPWVEFLRRGVSSGWEDLIKDLPECN